MTPTPVPVANNASVFAVDCTTQKAYVPMPFLGTDGKVETLFLAALARPPRSDERERFVRYVRAGGVRGDAGSALGDVFWVLLNSPEFRFNH